MLYGEPGCQRLLLKHQHSSVMIPEKKEREGERTFSKILFNNQKMCAISFSHTEIEMSIQVRAIRGRYSCRELQRHCQVRPNVSEKTNVSRLYSQSICTSVFDDTFNKTIGTCLFALVIRFLSQLYGSEQSNQPR